MAATPSLIVVMGPSGCGKSTAGQELAQRLGYAFLEGDDYHPACNRQKMANGEALTDHDRAVWIDRLVAAILATPSSAVTACSALTPYVQDRLRDESRRSVTFCLLQLDQTELEERVGGRFEHFMPMRLVASQLEALQPPADALVFDAAQAPDLLVNKMTKALEDGRE